MQYIRTLSKIFVFRYSLMAGGSVTAKSACFDFVSRQRTISTDAQKDVLERLKCLYADIVAVENRLEFIHSN